MAPQAHAHGQISHPPAVESHLHPNDPDTQRNLSVGLHTFEGLRYFPDGRENPDFILNQEPYRDASILIAGPNFGIGSMQAFAAIRLRGCGVRAVIAPSFGPVFYEDSFLYGILPVTLTPEEITTIVQAIAAHPSAEMTVDLPRQVIERSGMKTLAFHINPRLRSNLLLGEDDLNRVLKHRDDAESFQDENRRRRPWIYETDRDQL
jgi:3-isopropylmalate/(R)-2-methylmalate dehydratase small subunit